MKWHNVAIVFVAIISLISIFISYAHGIPTKNTGTEAIDRNLNPPHRILTQEEELLVRAAKNRIFQTGELLQAVSQAAQFIAKVNPQNPPLKGRQFAYSSEEEDDDEITVAKANRFVQSILSNQNRVVNLINFKGSKKSKGGSSLLLEAELDSLNEDELMDRLQHVLKELVTEKNGTNPSPASKVVQTPTTPKPPMSMMDMLTTVSRYANRDSILEALEGTRSAVEFLERLGIVDDVSAPITVGNVLLSGLEALVG